MRTLSFVALVACVVGLTGCFGSEEQDLQRWMAEQRAQVKPSVPPITEPKKFTPQAYAGKIVVLYFYPKDNTPGCTTEAMQFRDKYKDFVKAGATVFGVSRDNMKSHDEFKTKL